MFNGHIAHGFLVERLDEMVAYYTSKFGYQPQRANETFVLMDSTSPVRLFFWKYDHIAQHVGELDMANVKHKSLSAIIFETRSQVDEAYEALLLKNVHFIAAPRFWEWNAYAAYFVDNAGYMWELWTWN